MEDEAERAAFAESLVTDEVLAAEFADMLALRQLAAKAAAPPVPPVLREALFTTMFPPPPAGKTPAALPAGWMASVAVAVGLSIGALGTWIAGDGPPSQDIRAASANANGRPTTDHQASSSDRRRGVDLRSDEAAGMPRAVAPSTPERSSVGAVSNSVPTDVVGIDGTRNARGRRTSHGVHDIGGQDQDIRAIRSVPVEQGTRQAHGTPVADEVRTAVLTASSLPRPVDVVIPYATIASEIMSYETIVDVEERELVENSELVGIGESASVAPVDLAVASFVRTTGARPLEDLAVTLGVPLTRSLATGVVVGQVGGLWHAGLLGRWTFVPEASLRPMVLGMVGFDGSSVVTKAGAGLAWHVGPGLSATVAAEGIVQGGTVRPGIAVGIRLEP